VIKKYLKLFISPIFYINIFNEVINFFLNNLNKINLEKNFFKRHAFINSAISKYKNCNYLEIGVNKNDVFDSIPLKLKNKFGVDPVRGGNYKLTSDLFFKIYSQIKFDVIFIDGMHDYLQCQKDTINSINSLNKNGIIFIHDMLPKNFFEEHVPKIHYKWTGDIWKVGVELLNSKNLEFKIINIVNKI
jgi:hypothetical protein